MEFGAYSSATKWCIQGSSKSELSLFKEPFLMLFWWEMMIRLSSGGKLSSDIFECEDFTSELVNNVIWLLSD